VHNTFEWPDLYEYEEDLLRFYDHVVKGKDNGWEQTPRVRLSVLDPGGTDQINRPEETYPLPRAVETALYLDGHGAQISTERPNEEGHAEYDAAEGMVVFDYVAEHDFEIVGPMKLRLWLEVDMGNDADVFVYVRKAAADGQPLFSEVWPGTGIPALGANGRLRASHRELDSTTSTALVPVHRHERELPLEPGKPVVLDIDIWPHGMAWHAGQRLQVVVSGHDLMPPEGESSIEAELQSPNVGTHRIRTGGKFDSHLLVPVTG
jgi:predicted acyl esterase